MATKLVKSFIYRPSRNFLEISMLQFDKFFVIIECFYIMRAFDQKPSLYVEMCIAFQFGFKTLSWKLKKPTNIIILFLLTLNSNSCSWGEFQPKIWRYKPTSVAMETTRVFTLCDITIGSSLKSCFFGHIYCRSRTR